MKKQALFSPENNEKKLSMSSAAVVIGALRVKTFYLLYIIAFRY